MQVQLHRAEDRGRGDYGWLQTQYSFSFADWYEPSRMGFGALRVINDDVIAPGAGFDFHSHDNMEIVTIVTAGSVLHRDSMGSHYTVPAGDVQVMSAGTGVRHAEYNASETEALELFQVWITPRERNVEPQYHQKHFGFGATVGELELLAAPTEERGALALHQDAFVWYGSFRAGQGYSYTLRDVRHGVYLFVIDGAVEGAGTPLLRRDAMGLWECTEVPLSFTKDTQILLFEIPR